MNIGVCGTGTVAGWISSMLSQKNSDSIKLYACATSPGFDCTGFAAKYGYEKICSSFEELMDDPKVDLVYIAVPNVFHYGLAKQALEKGKNVFVEKPFAVNVRQTKELIEMAETKGLFLGEAVWPSCLPMQKEIDRIISEGLIGDIIGGTIITLDNVMFLDRVRKPGLGGGFMLDNGAYTIGFMTQHFGTDIENIRSESRKLDTGVDAEETITVRYRKGYTVTVCQRMDAEEQTESAEIIGSKGRIWLPGVANPEICQVYNENGEIIRTLHREKQIRNQDMPPVSGYDYEFEAVEKALREGRHELEEITHCRMLAIAQVVETVLLQAGIDLTER